MKRLFSELNTRKALGFLALLTLLFYSFSFFLNILVPNIQVLKCAIGNSAILLWLDGIIQGLSTELLGAIITIYIFDQIIGAREAAKAREEQQTQKRREDQLRSVTRLDEARHARDVKQALLKELNERKLLPGMDLKLHDFSGLFMSSFDLQKSDLSGTNLTGAVLRGANLSKAILDGATLEAADLRDCTLTGASLIGANLEQAILQNVTCDQQTILPDAKQWHPSINWEDYTNLRT